MELSEESKMEAQMYWAMVTSCYRFAGDGGIADAAFREIGTIVWRASGLIELARKIDGTGSVSLVTNPRCKRNLDAWEMLHVVNGMKMARAG